MDGMIRSGFKDVSSLNRFLRKDTDSDLVGGGLSIQPIIDFRLRTMNNVDMLRLSISTFLARPGYIPPTVDTTWMLLLLLEVC